MAKKILRRCGKCETFKTNERTYNDVWRSRIGKDHLILGQIAHVKAVDIYIKGYTDTEKTLVLNLSAFQNN